MKTTKPEMRNFPGGATRNTDEGKLDIEGFLSPFALRAYCEYLDSHRVQADGKLRDSDNWQSGFGPGVCMKSLMRHVWDAWMIHRGGTVIQDGKVVSKKEALCAAAFNIFSQLHDMEKPQSEEPVDGLEPDVRKPSCGLKKCANQALCDTRCVHHPDHERDSTEKKKPPVKLSGHRDNAPCSDCTLEGQCNRIIVGDVCYSHTQKKEPAVEPESHAKMSECGLLTCDDQGSRHCNKDCLAHPDHEKDSKLFLEAKAVARSTGHVLYCACDPCKKRREEEGTS